MKKMLAVLSAIGFLSISSSVGGLNFNQTSSILEIGKSADGTNFTSKEKSNNYDTIYTWSNININHFVETNKTRKDQKEDPAYDSKASAKSWDNLFMKARWIIITGYFALHTYTNADYFNDALLILNTKESNETTRVWEFSKTNDQWKGTGHHTSTVSLTLTADYDQEEEVTSLKLKSYIYARTAGAVHSCSTTSQINTAVFVENEN